MGKNEYLDSKQSLEIFNKTIEKNEIDKSSDSTGVQPVVHITDITAGILGLLLGIRFLLHLFGSVTSEGFGKFVVSITQSLVEPFEGIFPASKAGAMSDGIVEVSSLLSMVAVASIGYAIREMLRVLAESSENHYKSKPKTT